MLMTSMFTRILVPYDGSKYSKNALLRAIEVAHNLDSEIFLFSVINTAYISPPGMLHGLIKSDSEKIMIKKWNKKIKIETMKMLNLAVKKCNSYGITSSFSISEGNISKEILNFVKRKKITLIVMGSQGLSGLDKLKVLGSVSRKVCESAKCPVLIVK